MDTLTEIAKVVQSSDGVGIGGFHDSSPRDEAGVSRQLCEVVS